MPLRSQQILGNLNLEPRDLLNLPQAPSAFMHRMVYINFPMRVGAGNIERTRSKQPPHHLIGAIEPGVNISTSMTSKVYVVSTIN